MRFNIPSPDFDSDIVEMTFEVERLQQRLGGGSTPAHLFFEFHALFQILASMVSARIEGNRTTVLDALEGLSSPKPEEDQSEGVKEIQNLLTAIEYIDQYDFESLPFTHTFVRELHSKTVSNLKREGDPRPGNYRIVDVGIQNSNHQPPAHTLVQPEMDGVLDFMNQDVPVKQQMLHVAMAHHAFLWVHPFRNGNGRVARLLSYALLMKHKFGSARSVNAINPTAVFGNDRNSYYENLSAADDFSDAGLIQWGEFFVEGLLSDMQRVSDLQERSFVGEKLVLPAITRATRSGVLTLEESQCLAAKWSAAEVRPIELSQFFPGSPSTRSRKISDLVRRGLLKPTKPKGRIYRLSVVHNPLTPFVIRELDVNGFLPSILQED